jgi:hypothetical protein
MCGSRCIDTRILNLGTRYRWMVSFTARSSRRDNRLKLKINVSHTPAMLLQKYDFPLSWWIQLHTSYRVSDCIRSCARIARWGSLLPPVAELHFSSPCHCFQLVNKPVISSYDLTCSFSFELYRKTCKTITAISVLHDSSKPIYWLGYGPLGRCSGFPYRHWLQTGSATSPQPIIQWV